MEWIEQILRTKYIIMGFNYEISAVQCSLAVLSLFLGFTFGKILSFLVGSKLTKAAEKTASKGDDFLAKSTKKPLALLCQITGIYFALNFIGLPEKPYNIHYALTALFHAFLALDVTWFLLKFVDAFQIHLISKAKETNTGLDAQVVQLISKSLKTFIWILAGVLILQNLGYSISGLLAGLGLGGLAVAMAAKDTLANLFGSLTVFLDRPFRNGDIITVSNQTGVVEEIGFRSTRIRTFQDTVITVPNQTLTTANVENISKRKWRKVNTSIGLTYDTKLEQIKKIVASLQDILKKHPKILDDFLVNFSGFGESSLDISIIYKNNTTSYQEHLSIQHEINLEIMKCVEENKSDFAFPSRTIYMEKS